MVICSSSPASDFPMAIRLSSLDLPLLSTEFTFHFPLNWKYLAMLQTCSTLETPPPGTPLPLVSSFLSFFPPFSFGGLVYTTRWSLLSQFYIFVLEFCLIILVLTDWNSGLMIAGGMHAQTFFSINPV